MLLLALRNVARNRRRSVLTILAILMGLLSSNMLASIARGMSTQLVEDAIYTLTGHVQIHAAGYLRDPVVEHRFEVSKEIKAVLSQPPVVAWSSRIRIPVVVLSERDSLGVTLVGIDRSKEEGLSFIWEAVQIGRNLNDIGDKGIIIGKRLAKQLQTGLGKRIVVMGQDSNGSIADRGFRIVGLYESELEAKEKAYAFVGRSVAQSLFKMGASVSEVSIRAESRDELEPLIATLNEVSPKTDIQSWRTLEPFVTALVKMQNGVLYVWFGIVIISICFGLVNTIFMSVFERVKELGLYQALGMQPRQVLLHVLAESVVLLLIGAFFGNLLTVVMLEVFASGIDLSAFAKGTAMIGAKSVVYPTLLWRDTLVLNVFTVLIGVIASVYPAWRASQLEPARALSK